MTTSFLKITYTTLDDSTFLEDEDRMLLEEARNAIKTAYAPYSKFIVGSAALLQNGKIVMGSNQENASYPVGICSERILLAHASQAYPGIAIIKMAVSYLDPYKESNKPIFPCGMCRQALLEQTFRQKMDIEFFFSGQSGEVVLLNGIKTLLPFSFHPTSFSNSNSDEPTER